MKPPYIIESIGTHVLIRNDEYEQTLSIAEARWVSEALARVADEITTRCSVSMCDRIAEVRASFPISSEMHGHVWDFCGNHRAHLQVRDIDTGDVLFGGGA